MSAPAMVPSWALPFVCEIASRGSPGFMHALSASGKGYLRQVLTLNASHDTHPDWSAVLSHLGAPDVPAEIAPGICASRLLELRVKDLNALGPLLRLSPGISSALKKLSDYLSPYGYRRLALLDEEGTSASPRLRSLVIRAETLTARHVEAALEVDHALLGVPLARITSDSLTVQTLNRIVEEFRQIGPDAVDSLVQTLGKATSAYDARRKITAIVESHVRFTAPTLRTGSQLEAISSIGRLRSLGRSMQNCLASVFVRRVMAGDDLAFVYASEMNIVAVMKTLDGASSKSFLLTDIGTAENGPIPQPVSRQFRSVLMRDIEEPVWHISSRRSPKTPLERLLADPSGDEI